MPASAATNFANKCVFTIDVEDWFHILDLPLTPAITEWDSLPSRVEANFTKLLALLADTNIRATCFFLGWVAEKFPHLVRAAASAGHEVASHGYCHGLAYEMGPQRFYEDALHAKHILEDISGRAVLGYRASGFSATEKTPWFFEKLAQAGYRYDSSVFPAERGHGGMAGANTAPYRVSGMELVEFPATVESVGGKPLCFFGGGYLRLFPYSLIRSMSRRVLRQDRPVIFYVHPREIDPSHPRLKMSAARRFKSYVNLKTTEPKIRRILADFEFATFDELLSHWTKLGKAPIASTENTTVRGGSQEAVEA